MVNHNVVWLHVAVHDALAVTEVQGLEDFVSVVPDIEVRKSLVKSAEIAVTCLNKLHNERRGFGQRVAHHVKQIDDVLAVFEGLQDFDFTANLGFLDCAC